MVQPPHLFFFAENAKQIQRIDHHAKGIALVLLQALQGHLPQLAGKSPQQHLHHIVFAVEILIKAAPGDLRGLYDLIDGDLIIGDPADLGVDGIHQLLALFFGQIIKGRGGHACSSPCG